MTSTIDPLLDIQTKVLRATFVNNMAVLKKYMPDVFKFYENYSPTRVKLTFDKNGNLNLVSNGNLIYQDDPKLSSEQQVTEFLKKPRCLSYHVSQDGTGFYEHEKVLQTIVERRKNDVGESTQRIFPKDEQIDFIAFMGTGLGYHLQSLFASNTIRYAFVYEPDPDCFYCTLHSIDIGDMIKACFSRGGQLTLQIGGNSNGFVNEIARIFKRKGYFNVSKMFLYRHYLSDETNEAFQMVHDLAYRYVSGWGFCEDEITGLSHTLTNISTNNYPCLLETAKSRKRELPVFLVGNGPSLDFSFEYLKAHQDNAIILSCGTALKPLLDFGIIPDIHIEMERPAELFGWIDKVGHKDKLKQMELICINTVYPEILKLFKRAHLVLKPVDAGSTFIQEYISDKYSEVFYCNPTVSNAAAASAVAMGFKNLYLFGVDYGFKSEEHHHSKGSLYYRDNEGLDLGNNSVALSVPGNFEEKVLTTQVFDSSRMMMEMLLQANPDVNCVNTSDGALIQLSTPCQISDLVDFPIIAKKKEVIEQLLKESFDNAEYKACDHMAEFATLLPKLKAITKKIISLSSEVKTRLELIDAFTAQYELVNNFEHNRIHKMYHVIMHGTLNYLQSNIMSNTYLYADREQQEQFIQFALSTMNEHLLSLFEELKENYNKPAKF